jgi:hypothetical protein
MFCGPKEFSPQAYSNSDFTIKLLIFLISGRIPSWRGSIHRKTYTHAQKYTVVPVHTPSKFTAHDRIVSHEKEQRRADAAISLTIVISGSA